MNDTAPIAIHSSAWAGIRAALLEKDRQRAEHEQRLAERRQRDAERRALIAERTPDLPEPTGTTPIHVVHGWTAG